LAGSVARVVFLLLVLANLLFFAWAAGFLGGPDEGREPERLRGQHHPDRLDVKVRDERAPAQPPVPTGPEPAVEHGPATASSAAPDSSAMEKTDAVIVCRRIGPMPKADADKLARVLSDRGGKVAAPVALDGNSYWVFIPSGDDVSTDKTVAELKQAGISDFFVAGEGANKGAISLGVFHRQDAAKDLLQRLNKKGIKSAKIDVKPRRTDRVLLDVRAPAELIEQQLKGQSLPVANCPKE
jgi:biotin carboxyl carrier protein